MRRKERLGPGMTNCDGNDEPESVSVAADTPGEFGETACLELVPDA